MGDNICPKNNTFNVISVYKIKLACRLISGELDCYIKCKLPADPERGVPLKIIVRQLIKTCFCISIWEL